MMRIIALCVALAAGPVVAEPVRVDLRLANALQMGDAVLAGGVTAGQYTFDLDGPVVGHSFMGIFTTHLGDQSKTGYFVGTLHP